MKKILIADFSKGNEKAYVRGLYQHDYGAILKVTGIEYAEIIRVDFAGTNDEKAHPVVALQEPDGGFCVKIPKENTDKAGELSAYIYVTDAEAGFTIKEVILPIIKRIEADPDPSGEKTDPFAEAIEEIKKNAKAAGDSAASAAESEKTASESATQAKKSAVKSQKSAEAAAASEQAAATSATAAAQSASQSRESATTAQTAADQATKSATTATESETTAAQQAQNAAQSAANAARSAESAAQSAETAKTAADTAEKSASAAQQAVRSAAESASTASAAAQTATTAAGKASESATLAGQSAEMASQKATAAETSASNAAESATAAEKSATATGDSASAAKTSETATGEAAQTVQEQAEKIKASAEQIEKNKTDVTSLKEEKADKTTLAVTERKLDALWKLNQGISYKFEEDSESAYQKEVPSGAKLASVKRIGGKTIVWNQLIKNCEGETEITCTNADDYVSYRADFDIPVVGHKYLVSFECCIERTDVSFLLGLGNYFASVKLNNISNAWTKISRIVTVTSIEIPHKFFYIYFNAVPRTMEVGDSVKVRNVEVFDLTKMFGSGNEPSTPEEFEAMFPADYYPYNVGELRSACVSEVVEQGKNLLDVSNITDVDVDGKGSIRQGVIIPAVKGTYKISALKAENNIFVKRVVGNNYATPADLSSKEVSLTFDANGSIYVYATDGKIEGVQVEKGSVVTQYSPYRKNIYAISEAIRNLPGYGWSAGDVCNEIDWESKKYTQKIGHYEFSENTAVRLMKNNYTDVHCTFFAGAENVKVNIAVNGILSKNFASKYIGGSTGAEGVCCETAGWMEYKVLFKKLGCTKEDDDDTVIAAIKKYMIGIAEEANYPLVEPIVTDISNLIGNAFQEPFEVEAGGTLIFQNSHDGGFQIPVPSEEEYIVSLTEVGGVTE